MLASGALALACIDAAMAQSQNYPVRPIRVVVPYTPGGITDVVTRIVAQEVAKAVGQNVLVDNRPGANSILGAELVAKATPDGYTLASVIAAHAANQTLYPKLPYDSIKSFAPVSLLVTAPLIVTANNNLAAKDAKELVALAKAKPGALSFGSSGIGAAAHLTTELLMLTTGIKLNHVPYKGTGPAIIGLLSGEVQVAFSGAIATVPHVRGGRLRALAVAGDKRARALPDVPTVAEQGYPGYEANSWNGIVAPAKTPRPIVDKLNTAIIKVLQMRDVREHMIADGAEPTHNTPEEFGALIASGHAKWTKVINAAGLKEKI